MMTSAESWPLTAFGGAADVLLASFAAVSTSHKLSVSCNSPVLVAGPHGAGKTSLICSAAKQTEIGAIVCDSSWVCGPATIDFVGAIDEIKRKVAERGPVAVVFDNLDLMFPADDVHVDARALLSLCSLIEHSPTNCIVVGVCSAADSLNPRLLRCFQEHIHLKVPSIQQRCIMFDAAFGHRFPCWSEDVRCRLATLAGTHAHAYLPSDVVTIANQLAAYDLETQTEPTVSARLLTLLAKTKPTVLSSSTLTVTTPSLSWDDVVGLQAVKDSLREVVVLPSQHPEAFARLGIEPPRGVLLYGPPGTGKTMLARVVAAQCRANFLNIGIPDIIRSGVGDSEKALATVFKLAFAVRPCVVFFDEFQALFRARQDGDGSEGRITTQLILELSAAPRNVIVIAATNHPAMIDSALLRPGRFDRILHVPLPSLSDRAQILRSLLTRLGWNESVDIAWLAQATEGYSPADLECVCRRVVIDCIAANGGSVPVDGFAVTDASFRDALCSVKPALSREEAVLLTNWRPK